MHLRHVVPFIALFAWQAAPAPRPHPSNLRISFGAGSGSFDYRYWRVLTLGGQCLAEYASCDACASAAPSHVDTAIADVKDEAPANGMQVDAWPSARIRVSASLGSSGVQAQRVLAGLVAWEGEHAGLGVGWADTRSADGLRGVAAYARLGAADGAQFRAELRTPTATPGATGWAHAGFASAQGRRGGLLEVFLGVSAVETVPDGVRGEGDPALAGRHVTRPAVFADVLLPFSRGFGIYVRGHRGRSTRGLGFGAAFRF